MLSSVSRISWSALRSTGGNCAGVRARDLDVDALGHLGVGFERDLGVDGVEGGVGVGRRLPAPPAACAWVMAVRRLAAAVAAAPPVRCARPERMRLPGGCGVGGWPLGPGVCVGSGAGGAMRGVGGVVDFAERPVSDAVCGGDVFDLPVKMDGVPGLDWRSDGDGRRQCAGDTALATRGP